MLLSMTGFGEARAESDSLILSIELRALNNRYLKISLRASDPYHLLEPEIEKVIRKTVRRGTLQVHLRCEQTAQDANHRINAQALSSYLTQINELLAELKMQEHREMLLGQVLSLPGIVAEAAYDTSRLEKDWPLVREVLVEALTRLQKMRSEEGAAMAQELLNYRDLIRHHLDAIGERIPTVATMYRDRLYERVKNILSEHHIELERHELIKEVSIFSERSDIAEEVIRLNSHLDQFQEMMKEQESPGRKLEFLTQEMFREANTIGSKAGDTEISRHVVEIKGTLEKIRELVQNVE
ncbi:MAG: YicC/YloC family endoribonuclease [Gemmataceae bacterium]